MRSILIACCVVAVMIALAPPAEAGLLLRLFGRSACVGGSCGKSVVKPLAKPQYRVECKNGVCRRVEVK